MTAPPGQLPSTRDVVNRVFGGVKEYSKLIGQIPSDDYDYHQAFPGFRRQVDEQSDVLIQLMDTCTKLLPKRRRVCLMDSDAARGANRPSSARELTEAQRTVVMESIDSLLENVDTVLDDLRGRKMRSADQLSVTFGSELTATGAGAGSNAAVGKGGGGALQHVAHVMRPQLSFEAPVDNSDTPFVPVYHDAQGRKHTGTAGVHPFADVINNATLPPDQLLPKAEIPPVPLSACPLTFIDTPEDLQRVVADEWMHATEMAVDLEHHDFYSYQGFTCLMQVSTRTADFIVDCLKLRSSMHLIAPVFLNPRILKVLHGAREDVRWLQKDFGLYLVNFFDTGVALQTLHMPYSLAFAVDHFFQVKLNKKYQTADWRVRPLPAEMVHYARQDTHYLLYVYDRLKALLLNSEGRASVGNLLLHVYAESRRLSLELYEKPHLHPNQSYKAALGRSLGGLSPVQERVARDVFNWRDAAAREADDSPTAVLHLSSVLAIASKLPTSARELLRCCSPVSVVLRRDVGRLVELVKAALGEAAGSAAAAAASVAGTHAADAGAPAGTLRADVALFYARPVGIYRPMTGALPSVSTRLAPAAPAAAPEAAVSTLAKTAPSLWSQAMRALATTNASRPQPHVPLPGSDVLALMQAKAQQRIKQAKAEAAEEQSAKRVRKESPSSSNSSSRGGGNPSDSDVAHIDAEANGSSSTAPPPQAGETMAFPAGAFSLRQEFGTGAQDRRKAKANATKKSKKK